MLWWHKLTCLVFSRFTDFAFAAHRHKYQLTPSCLMQEEFSERLSVFCTSQSSPAVNPLPTHYPGHTTAAVSDQLGLSLLNQGDHYTIYCCPCMKATTSSSYQRAVAVLNDQIYVGYRVTHNCLHHALYFVTTSND